MNIYQIQQNLLNIFDTLEETGGELTPELEEQFTINEDAFKEKIESYTNVIKMLNNDIDSIKVEQKRLKDLSDRKQKVINKLKEIIIEGISNFGSTKKSGVKYIDYGTGEVSVRNTVAVDVDTDVLKEIGNAVELVAQYAKDTNQLDVVDKLDCESIIKVVAEPTKDDNDVEHGYIVTEDDLRHTNIELSVKVPLSELITGEAYPIIKEIAKHTIAFEANASVSKTDLKKELTENGSCAPNLAKLVTNRNVVIK